MPGREREPHVISARPSMLPGVSTLREPLTRALGPKTGKLLETAFAMATVGDLLRHSPRRYYSRGELTDLCSLREGDHVTVLARVAHVSVHPMPNRNFRARGEVIITDDRAKLMLTCFFRTTRAEYGFRKNLVSGMVGMFAGAVSSFRGRLQLIHPEYELLPGAPPNADLTPELAAEFAAELIPVYPASAKASSWLIARSVKTILDPLDAGEDPLPAQLRERYGLYGRAEAIRAIHRPLDWADRNRAIERLKWDEAFMLQAALAQRRVAAAALPAMPRPHMPGRLAHEARARPPVPPTPGPGAVGEEQVQLGDLGGVVSEEQPRCGGEQRDALRAKAADNRPHVLVMTATPIPRTVAMTVYGDLETSTLTELPAGRSAIATHVVPAADKPHFLERAWARVREEVERGRQAYVVCPRIVDGPDPDEDDYADQDDDFAAMETTTVDLSHGVPRSITNVGRRQPLSVLDVAATLDAAPLAGLRLGAPHRRPHPRGEGPG